MSGGRASNGHRGYAGATDEDITKLIAKLERGCYTLEKEIMQYKTQRKFWEDIIMETMD